MITILQEITALLVGIHPAITHPVRSHLVITILQEITVLLTGILRTKMTWMKSTGAAMELTGTVTELSGINRKESHYGRCSKM